jgi:arylsulfatase A-like enzyme/Flp pilus assembly protein TadD
MGLLMRGVRSFFCIVILIMSALGAESSEAQKSDGVASANTAKPEQGHPGTPEQAYPNIVLITLDTTRADRMGFLGSTRGLTPNLDALALDSAVFIRAYSQAPLTPASHSTILTGTYPQYHQVLIFPIPLGKDIPFMPDILHAHGYTTAAFVGSLALDPTWGVPGFERGFDTYDAGFGWDGYTPEKRYQVTERRGGEVVDHALAWLSKHQQRPFFMWVHLFDPHEPYDPPEPYKTRYAKALYDGEIAYADSAMGKFLGELKKQGLYDGTLIALAADHGESLGAHGEDTHGIFLYDETIHVPLLIKLPNGGSAGRRIENPVELADIVPTVLQRIGIEVPKQVQGVSLLELMKTGPEGEAEARAWSSRGAYSQADYGHLAFGWSAEQSLRTGKYLYIQAPRRELYEAEIDRLAEHNLASASPAVADTLSARVDDFRQKTTNTGETPKSQMDEANMKKLTALGYMPSRGDSPYAAPGEQGADPKDKIATANTILRINNILQDFRCDKAEPELHKAIIEYPDLPLLHFFLGGCYLEKKDFENAAVELRKAVKLDPGFTHAEMNLGSALMYSHHYEEAAIAFQHVTKTEPHILNAHVFLIVAYTKLDRTQDVVTECRAVLKIFPNNFGANLHLGQALAKLGDLQSAIPPLELAMKGEPVRPEPHLALAEVYDQMGKDDDAERERAEAERLGAVPLRPPDTGK